MATNKEGTEELPKGDKAARKKKTRKLETEERRKRLDSICRKIAQA